MDRFETRDRAGERDGKELPDGGADVAPGTYTLGIVANALAIAAPNDPLLSSIMKQLDAGSSAYRQQIERDLAARLGQQQAPRAATVTCACGVANDPDARFCKACGARVTEKTK